MRALGRRERAGSPWTRNVRPGRRREGREPARELGLVGVGGEAGRGATCAFTGTSSPWMRSVGGAGLERPAARARRLEADEEHGRARVGEAPRQVVEDAPAGRHAGGGEDHARPASRRSSAFDCSGLRQKVRRLRAGAAPRRPRCAGPSPRRGPRGGRGNRRRVHRHRRVHEDGERRDRAALLEPRSVKSTSCVRPIAKAGTTSAPPGCGWPAGPRRASASRASPRRGASRRRCSRGRARRRRAPGSGSGRMGAP